MMPAHLHRRSLGEETREKGQCPSRVGRPVPLRERMGFTGSGRGGAPDRASTCGIHLLRADSDSRRMYAAGRHGAEVQPCSLRQAEACEALQQYVCCVVGRRAGRYWLALPPLPSDATATAALIRVLGTGGIYATRAAPWIDAACAAADVSRHVSRCRRPRGAVVARLEEVVRRHPSCRAALAPAALEAGRHSAYSWRWLDAALLGFGTAICPAWAAACLRRGSGRRPFLCGAARPARSRGAGCGWGGAVSGVFYRGTETTCTWPLGLSIWICLLVCLVALPPWELAPCSQGMFGPHKSWESIAAQHRTFRDMFCDTAEARQGTNISSARLYHSMLRWFRGRGSLAAGGKDASVQYTSCGCSSHVAFLTILLCDGCVLYLPTSLGLWALL